ncbi:MAG: tetratricopeptide repeat protein [Elusimicrobiota bacterium]
MTKKWVKDELRKNRLENAVISSIKYAKENRNNIYVVIVSVIVIFLFIGVVVKNRGKETIAASKLLAFAQLDFDRFNYDAAIKKIDNIEETFKTTSVIPQALYFKGLSYYRKGNHEQAREILEKCIGFRKNKIEPEARLSLATVCEEMGKYEDALEHYNNIKDDHYLKPEALMGMARIYELTKRTEEAIDVYTKVQSHYVNTYWGNLAGMRLYAFGIGPKETEKITPEIDFN